MNEPVGRFGSLMPARARRIALRDGHDRLLLADDALVQLVLHADELLRLGLGELEDRDARPHRDDVGDLLLADLGLLAVASFGAPVLLELALLLRQLALLVAQRRGLLELLRPRSRLPCPCAPSRSRPRARGSAAARSSSDAHARRGLVDQVDRLVGQVAVLDVAVGERRGRDAARRRRSCSGGAPRSGRAGRAGSARCRRPTAPRRGSAGSAARARRRARGTCGTRRASSRRSSAARRARARA